MSLRWYLVNLVAVHDITHMKRMEIAAITVAGLYDDQEEKSYAQISRVLIAKYN